jgi:SAM-dependent methyltransferase
MPHEGNLVSAIPAVVCHPRRNRQWLAVWWIWVQRLMLFSTMISWMQRRQQPQQHDSLRLVELVSAYHIIPLFTMTCRKRRLPQQHYQLQYHSHFQPREARTVINKCHSDEGVIEDSTTTTVAVDEYPTTTTITQNASSSTPSNLFREIQTLIDLRSRARIRGDYQTADALKEQLHQLQLPPYCQLIIQDVPRSQGGQSIWKLELLNFKESNQTPRQHTSDSLSVLQLAHRILGLAVSSSQTRMLSTKQMHIRMQAMIEQAKKILEDWNIIHQQFSILETNTTTCTMSSTTVPQSWWDNNDFHQVFFTVTSTSQRQQQQQQQLHSWRQVELTLRGRKAADATFWLALAGVTDVRLFQLLQDVTVKELRRFGTKPTCRAKDIFQIMDRFAAAGIQPPRSYRIDDDDYDLPPLLLLEQVARDCLQSKEYNQDDNIFQKKDISTTSSSSLLDLHSNRTLLMLWKFAAGQKKQQSFLQVAQKHWETTSLSDKNYNSTKLNAGLVNSLQTACTVDWHDLFSDPTKPLVLDVGCGMGISLLGLATITNTSKYNEFAGCNLLGVDLSGLTIGYAQGMAHRWKLTHRLQFVVDSAESLLQTFIESYPGIMSLCMIQFPTPYLLSNSTSGNSVRNSGNSQLPPSPNDGFMVSSKLLTLVQKALCIRDNTDGRLLLQSNCEDVAVYMRQTAMEHGGYIGMDALDPLVEPETENLPQRTLNWLATLKDDEGRVNLSYRASGKFWSMTSPLPSKACTETEVACRLNRIPIHRCVLKSISIE